MGDISVIARRLSEKNVQYGWSGNAGYPETVGARLWSYYNTPEMVEYLFSLGQLRQLCAPGGETSDDILPGTFRTEPTGRPHWVTTSELDIYSRIAFVDHAYLYDSDNTWYYIAPLIMHILIFPHFLQNLRAGLPGKANDISLALIRIANHHLALPVSALQTANTSFAVGSFSSHITSPHATGGSVSGQNVICCTQARNAVRGIRIQLPSRHTGKSLRWVSSYALA